MQSDHTCTLNPQDPFLPLPTPTPSNSSTPYFQVSLFCDPMRGQLHEHGSVGNSLISGYSLAPDDVEGGLRFSQKAVASSHGNHSTAGPVGTSSLAGQDDSMQGPQLGRRWIT